MELFSENCSHNNHKGRNTALPLAVTHLYVIHTQMLICAFSALMLLIRQQKGNLACKKTQWWGAGMVICLRQGADLHISQLMPMPLNVSCFSKIQICFTLLIPAHLGSSGQRAVKLVLLLLTYVYNIHNDWMPCMAQPFQIYPGLRQAPNMLHQYKTHMRHGYARINVLLANYLCRLES